MQELDMNSAVVRLRQILHEPSLEHWNELLDIVEKFPLLVEYADSHIVESWPHTLRRSDNWTHPGLSLVRILTLEDSSPAVQKQAQEVLRSPTLLSNLTMLNIQLDKTKISWIPLLLKSTALKKLTHLFLRLPGLSSKEHKRLKESELFQGLRYSSVSHQERY